MQSISTRTLSQSLGQACPAGQKGLFPVGYSVLVAVTGQLGKARRGDDHRAEVEAMLDAAGAVTLEDGLTLDEAAAKLAGDPGERSEMEWNRDVEMWKSRLADGSRPPRRQPNKPPAMLGLFAQSRRLGGKAQNFWFVEARLAQ